MPEETTPAGEPTTEPTATTPPGDAPGDQSATEEKQFTKSQMEAIVRDRLESQKRAAEAQSKRTKDEAEATRLKEQAEWQKLAEQHETKVKELEPQFAALTEEAEALRVIVAAQLDEQIKDWPPEVKSLIPTEGNLVARHESVKAHKPLADKLMGTPPPAGNGPNPRASGNAGVGVSRDQTIDRIREQMRSRF